MRGQSGTIAPGPLVESSVLMMSDALAAAGRQDCRVSLGV